ncbi:hypothetical protein AKJ16_DCAP03955 [Drosera capensis]
MVALVFYDVSMYQKTTWRLLLEHVTCKLRLGYYTIDAVCFAAKNGTRNSKLMVALCHGITKGYVPSLRRSVRYCKFNVGKATILQFMH